MSFKNATTRRTRSAVVFSTSGSTYDAALNVSLSKAAAVSRRRFCHASRSAFALGPIVLSPSSFGSIFSFWMTVISEIRAPGPVARRRVVGRKGVRASGERRRELLSLRGREDAVKVLERLSVGGRDLGAGLSELPRVELERLFVDDARAHGRRHVDREHLAHLLDALVPFFGGRDELHELIVLRVLELQVRDGVGDEDEDADLRRRVARRHDLGRRLGGRGVEPQPAVRRAAADEECSYENESTHQFGLTVPPPSAQPSEDCWIAASAAMKPCGLPSPTFQ